MSKGLEWFRCESCSQNRLAGTIHGNGPICYDCRALMSGSDMNHASMVRCPKCHHVEEVMPDGDSCQFYEEGDHPFTCGECEHEYRIVTHVSFEFESPEAVETGEEL